MGSVGSAWGRVGASLGVMGLKQLCRAWGRVQKGLALAVTPPSTLGYSIFISMPFINMLNVFAPPDCNPRRMRPRIFVFIYCHIPQGRESSLGYERCLMSTCWRKPHAFPESTPCNQILTNVKM